MTGINWVGLGGWEAQVDFGPRGAQGAEVIDLSSLLGLFSLFSVSLVLCYHLA